MKIIGIVLAVVLVAVGAMFNKLNPRSEKQDIKPSEVLSEQEEETLPTEEPEQITPTEKPKGKIPTATPIPTKVVIKGNISNYRYPNTEIITSSENTLSLKSFDEQKTITNWYKEKILNEGMNVKTFVETNANDNILNKLVGADGQKEIRVEIKKDVGTSFVQIEVSLKTTS